MAGIFPKLRFLPIMIFFATLMLTVKIGNIWNGFDALNDPTISITEAQAQVDPDAPAAEGEPAMEPSSDPVESASVPAAEEEPMAPDVPASPLITQDPTLLTIAEIELLQKLTARREVIEIRERELVVRDGLMKAAEVRINEKIAELQRLEKTIEGLITDFDGQQDQKLLSLVKIYENMKPKDAARIFEDLELDTLLEVAEQMKERKLAPIMAKMNPEKAREMTVELRRMRELPAVRG